MAYQIEFLAVGNGAKSGDAILFRWLERTSTGNQQKVMVIDGGYRETGEEIRNIIRNIYGTDVIDHIVSTHPDNDHIGGLSLLVETMQVRNLWIHLPANHTPDIINLFESTRWQTPNLAAHIRREYSCAHDLAALARSNGANVFEPFAGARIGPFVVLSPTVDMYRGLLPQFRGTPAPDVNLLSQWGHWLEGIGRRIANTISEVVPESWDVETLREGGITSAENESSVILYGQIDGNNLLLTSDAGLKALGLAVTNANALGLPLGESLTLFQVPHHGSRNNISPTMLNRIIGQKVQRGIRRNICCIVSAAVDDPHHPRKVVKNALWRRGLQPFVTRDGGVSYGNVQMSGGSIQPEPFSNVVEAYD